MSESITYQSCNDELKKLFEGATANSSDSFAKLAAILSEASPATSDEWKAEVVQFWTGGLADFARNNSLGSIPENAVALVRAMLDAALDSADFRSLYETLAKQQFKNYFDKDGLFNALSINQEDVALAHIAQKWKVMEEVADAHIFCFERSLGVGEVIQIDDMGNEVKISCDDLPDPHKATKGKSGKDSAQGNDASAAKFSNIKRKHIISLRSFLENAIVVKKGTDVEKWLRKEDKPSKMPQAELEALVRSCVVTAHTLPMNLTRALLVPRILSDTTLRNLTNVSNVPQEKEAASPVQGSRWDASRSIQELVERLKTATDFSCNEGTDLNNVSTILKGASIREDYTGMFALAIAILQEHSSNYQEWFNNLIKQITDEAIVWKQEDLFATTSNEMAGKQIQDWFRATYSAKGPEYLVEQTCGLPFKLWAHTEKLLAGTEFKNLLHDVVESKLSTGKVSADLLYWVWKSDYDDLKKTYLTDAPLIFKTLLKEVKSYYLKAQRDLHRMLLSDEKFQRQIMKDGDQAAVASLVRCAKRMSLLDAGERQSLLVQIVRLYPDALEMVADKKMLQARSTLPRITSIRSLKARQMELEHIINKLIPENTKAIEVARGYGDLRENSEFKFAKERQRFLNNRRSEYEKSLLDIRATDFRSVEVNNNVVPGCTVVLRNESTGQEESYHILGLMDTMPEKNIISFEAPLGKILLGHKTGDHIDLPNGQKAIIREIKKLSNDMLDWLSADPDPIQD